MITCKTTAHFEDCPSLREYDVCTCDMRGEEACIIKWQIDKQEGNLKWYDISAHLTLRFFGCGPIIRNRSAP